MTKFMYFGSTSSYRNILVLIVLFSFCNCERIKRQGWKFITQKVEKLEKFNGKNNKDTYYYYKARHFEKKASPSINRLREGAMSGDRGRTKRKEDKRKMELTKDLIYPNSKLIPEDEEMRGFKPVSWTRPWDHCVRFRDRFLDLTQISRCRTPLGEVGLCLAIKQCSSLMDLLLKQRHRPEVVNYLRSSVCGYENLEPKVCCTELQDPSSLLTTPTPFRPTTPPFRPQTTTASSERYEDGRSILPQPGECGVSPQFNVRVVGGSNASLGAWPWVVALGYRSTKNPTVPQYLCGGSLITNRHVLTAAHCVYNRKTLFMARLGDLNLFDDNDGASPVNILIAERIIHNGYNPTTFVNDIAVLKLERPVQFTRLIKPICIPIEPELRTKNLVNRKPFIAGWGTISYNGPSSPVLQQLQVPVVSDSECRRAFSTFKTAVIDERVVCAGYLRGGKDACRGDSGGPLMDFEFKNKLGVFYQIGVVSYGYKCAEPGFPGVYTRVSSFTDWILDAVSK